MKCKVASVLALVVLLMSALAQAREQGTLEQCQRIQERINHYTDLKRQGGDSQRMAYLHKKRNAHKDDYQRLSCRIYRGQLK